MSELAARVRVAGESSGIRLFVSMIRTAHQRARFDVHETQSQRDSLELAEFIRVVIARHHRVVL